MACVREATGLIIILLSLFGNDRNGRTLAKSRRLATHLELLELTPVKVFCISKKSFFRAVEAWKPLVPRPCTQEFTTAQD